MTNYFYIYTSKSGDVLSDLREFDSFKDCEDYLKNIGATYWEIELPIHSTV